jgi:hypothetical protein
MRNPWWISVIRRWWFDSTSSLHFSDLPLNIHYIINNKGDDMKIQVLFEDLRGEDWFINQLLESKDQQDLLEQARKYFVTNKSKAIWENDNQPVNGNWDILDWSDGHQKTEFQLKMHNMLLELGM